MCILNSDKYCQIDFTEVKSIYIPVSKTSKVFSHLQYKLLKFFFVFVNLIGENGIS